MKRLFATIIALILLLSIPFMSLAESKELPKADEDGNITYLGEVGLRDDGNGNFLVASLFDQAVIELKYRDAISDACIMVNETEKDVTIVIVVKDASDKAEVRDICDSAVKTVGTTFSFGSYEGPSMDYYGSIFDEYDLVIGAFDKDKNQVCIGGKSKTSPVIAW